LGAGSGSRRALDGPAPASFVFVLVLLDLAAGSRTVCTRVPGPLAFRGGRWNLFRRDGRRGDVLKLLVFDKSKPDLHWKKKRSRPVKVNLNYLRRPESHTHGPYRSMFRF
jgi:hypothetical protein